MIITGVIEDKKTEISNIINSILISAGRKTCLASYKTLCEKNSEALREYISAHEKSYTEILILKLNTDDAEIASRSIRIDILVINKQCFFSDIWLKKLKKEGVLVINIDECIITDVPEKINYFTFGFNSRADITASSTGDIESDFILCSLNKELSTYNGRKIEPQEFKMEISDLSLNTYSALAAISVALINDVNPNNLEKTNK